METNQTEAASPRSPITEQDNLLRKIAHDMRSPLQAMTGNLQLLEMIAGEKLTSEELGFLHQSLEASERLRLQIDSIEPSTSLLN